MTHYLGRICLYTTIVLSILAGVPRPTYAAPPLPVATEGTISVVAEGAGEPDDLVVAPDGTIYYSDLHLNKIIALTRDSHWSPVSPRISAPEGLVILDGGDLVVVEQNTNKLLRLDPVMGTQSLYFAVGNKTYNPGIDSITLDSLTGDLIIPDAPTGRLLRLHDGKTLSVIAEHFRRPTAAAIALDGSIYVCDEYGYQIDQVAVDGSVTLVARITLPDDVILDHDGNLLVNSLRGTVYRIRLPSRTVEPLVTGLVEPHGIALDLDENLIIADAKLNRIYRLTFPPRS